ncbi:DNA-directed RNA polymerase subunit beta [Candidatus Xenohaliotis californiensis]
MRSRIDGKAIELDKLPNMLDVQKESYARFLYGRDGVEEDSGIASVFKGIFPIVDAGNKATLDFVSYSLKEPKFNEDECVQRGITYAATVRALMRLIVWVESEETKSKEIKSIKEQEVYISNIPLMTTKGTFVINGCEYVVVSQMHRSPGVFFDHDRGKNYSSGKILYSTRIIPYRGSWLDFEFDIKDLIYFRIDRKRKMHVSTLLYALGLNKQEIIDFFYNKITFNYNIKEDFWFVNLKLRDFLGFKSFFTLRNMETGEVILEKNTRINQRVIAKLISAKLPISGDFRIDHSVCDELFIAHDIVDKNDNRVTISVGESINGSHFDLIYSLGIESFSILVVDDVYAGNYILNTLKADKNSMKTDALIEIYKVIRPGELANAEIVESLLEGLFFDKDKYDLSDVGRVKMNAKLGLDIPEDHHTLSKADVLHVIKALIAVKDGKMPIDDIDHLGNRRVKAVGELVENQFRIGLMKIARVSVERLSSVDLDSVMPHDLINSKLLTSLIKEFFSVSQLSQFMDQTNPLSEITHKRRLSALGPGGLTRERAGYEVRDVHTTHYGRICPVETPEGQNIGLVNSLAICATVNRYGFIESPYYKVVNGAVTNELHYLSAIEEEKYNIAQASYALDDKDVFIDEIICCRKSGELVNVMRNEVNFVDISPKQVVSVAASLIPFLENNDANRALMGSNMQRQAVPLMIAEAPMVGTGVEYIVARDSGAVIIAKSDGIVRWVDAARIVICSEKTGDMDVYSLQKFRRSNYNTNIGHAPRVKRGDIVHKGNIIADNTATDNGELALGKSVLVAFMPWHGYNFEDSIIISERLVSDDVFTSIHIEELECVARDTRLGPEEVTRSLPNINEAKLVNLDESGIVNIGVKVKPGDILVGKITPKSELPMTPEEKLLRIIFGERASDVRDSSLYVPSGISGTVIDVWILSVHGVEKDQRLHLIEQQKKSNLRKDYNIKLLILNEYFFNQIKDITLGQILSKNFNGFAPSYKIQEDMFVKLLNDGKTGHDVAIKKLWNISVDNQSILKEIKQFKVKYDLLFKKLEDDYNIAAERLLVDSELPQGVLKIVKIFLASKQKLQPGDKMAGRHGNKGVVSKIVPVEDMPYLEDGTLVDIILNPLGVPSRMNVGQILEAHLGWLCKQTGKKIADAFNNMNTLEDVDSLRSLLSKVYTNKADHNVISRCNVDDLRSLANSLKKGALLAAPVFEAPSEELMDDFAKNIGISSVDSVILTDGLTGEKFDRTVTVGYIYMMKLHHLVNNKIHARSVGPYSLITQQPLGGKSHFGGQRFGEMECWALQAYGAAYTLQEMLTVKSDDVKGRVKVYESIIRGVNELECGMPESFNVMIEELRSLCLNIELQDAVE